MTTHDSVGTQPTPRNLTRALVIVLVVALALLATAFAVASSRPADENADGAAAPTAKPTAAAPSAEPTADPSGLITPVIADRAVARFLTAVASTPPADWSSIASGAIAEDLQNEAQELEANGWTRVGRAKVDGVTVSASDPADGTATVVACVDSSAVATLDKNGDRLAPPATARALNIYSLARSDGIWRIVSRTFPDETAC